MKAKSAVGAPPQSVREIEDAQVVVATVPEMEAATKPCYVKAKGMTGAPTPGTATATA